MEESLKTMTELFSLDAETAVVTGGASGIGEKIAEYFYAMGANVVLADLNGDALKTQCDKMLSLAGENRRCEMFQCDIADEGNVRELLDLAVGKFGKVDILVNSHGISRRASADDITAEQFDTVINVNLRSVFLTTTVIGRHMAQHRKGSIINISSIAAHVCLPNNVNYAAAKGGLEAMTRSFAGEWGGKGVRVNAIAPGPCITGFTEALYADPVYVESLTKKIPRGEISIPRDLAGPALLLASSAGANITGQVLLVDGGFTIL